MSTVAAPVEDTCLELIEALDFDPPCEIQTFTIPCGFPSEWFMVLRCHCSNGTTADVGTMGVLTCQTHYEAILNGAPGVCVGCGAVLPDLLSYVIRTERIKP